MGVTVLAVIFLEKHNQLFDVARRNRWVNQQHIRGRSRQGNGSKIFERIVWNFRVEAGIDNITRADNHDGVTVRSRSRSGTHAKISTGARVVLDVELLTETAREISRDNAGKEMGWASRGKVHAHAHGSRRVGLRLCHPGNERHSRGTGSQKKKSASSKIH